MVMASARTTHFAEQHVQRIVEDNLRSLLQHCSHTDMSFCRDAHSIVFNYGQGALPWVQKLIAEAMQDLIEDLLASAEISEDTVHLVCLCCAPLENVLRSLGRPQRQTWVSLLVRLLFLPEFSSEWLFIVDDLMLLWRSDDDPKRNFAEAEQQIWALMRSTTSRDLQRKLQQLILAC